MTTSERESLGAHEHVAHRAESRVRAGRPRPTRGPGRTGRRVLFARLAIALLVSGVVAAALWWTRPTELEQPDDIVGYPSFFDYNFQPVFLAHRLLTWVIPGVATLVYLLLARFGPLAAPPRRPQTTADAEPAEEDARDPERATPLG